RLTFETHLLGPPLHSALTFQLLPKPCFSMNTHVRVRVRARPDVIVTGWCIDFLPDPGQASRSRAQIPPNACSNISSGVVANPGGEMVGCSTFGKLPTTMGGGETSGTGGAGRGGIAGAPPLPGHGSALGSGGRGFQLSTMVRP